MNIKRGMKKRKEEDISDKIKLFEEELKLHIQEKANNDSVLTVIKEKYEDSIYKRDEFQKKIFDIKSEIREMAEERFGRECKELIDQLCFFEKIDRDELMDRAFIKGFTIAAKLEDEIQKKEIEIERCNS